MENQKIVLKQEFESFKDKHDCKNCPINPKAEKPYKKMVRQELTPLTKKILNEINDKYGIEPACFTCYSVGSFFELSPEMRLEKLKELAKYKDN